MKRARVRLVLVAGVIGGLAVMAQIGQERRPATPTAQEVTSPPTPLLEERGESATITPLEADVAALVGVRGVGVVISTGGTVYMEIDVLEGYAAQPQKKSSTLTSKPRCFITCITAIPCCLLLPRHNCDARSTH